jgi:hypothetical protein
VGVTAPERLRSAADVPELHRPWSVALAIGLLSIEGTRAGRGPAIAGWPSATDDDVLAGWLRGLANVLADTYDESDPIDALEIGRSTLTVLARDQAGTTADLYEDLVETLFDADHTLCWIFTRGPGRGHPIDVVLELLAAFGAAERSDGRWRITSLGRWAIPELSSHRTSLLGASDVAEGIYRLKVTLRHVRPACWRRILVPADVTLGDLHEVIRIAFAWDDDHLHAFAVGPRRYGDPSFDFEYDEDAITLSAAFARSRGPLGYVYDLGDNWDHEIVLETAVEPDASLTYPICVDGRGDSPVEDWNEEFGDPAWITFDRADINIRLARLGSGIQANGPNHRPI